MSGFLATEVKVMQIWIGFDKPARLIVFFKLNQNDYKYWDSNAVQIGCDTAKSDKMNFVSV